MDASEYNAMTLSESDEQIALFRWAQLSSAAHKELDLLYHIPNGGKRNAATAKRLKAEGVKPGVPDLCLPVARGGYHSLYIELKSGRNKPTENQKKWIEGLNEQKNLAVVCWGWLEASDTIMDYLYGRLMLNQQKGDKHDA